MPDVAPLRSALVAFLDEHNMEISDEITTLIVDTIERVKVDNVDYEPVRISTYSNLELLRHVVSQPDDLTLAEPPLGAMSLVRQLARRGIPLYEIIRSYQLGHSRWMQICTRELASLTTDVAALASECIELNAISNKYFDLLCQRIAVEYEDERDRWLRQAESVRIDRVLAMVEGRPVDTDETEQALGYRLRQRHLAAVAWTDPDISSGDELIRAQRALAVAAELLGGGAHKLVITRDAWTVWAWIPQPERDLLAADLVADIERKVTADEPGVRLAFGNPGRGPEGFTLSHRQAMAAHGVGRLCADRAVFPYRDVSALAFLAGAPEHARNWVREVLGGLALRARREDELRHTLRVYLEVQQSATKAARELTCHKNTILYRLGLIEKLLGHGVEEDSLHIALALHACEWFGESFLDPPP